MMNADLTYDEQQQGPDLKAGIVKRAIQVLVQILIQAVILFLSSGRLDWGWAWGFIGLNLVGVSINSAIMLRVCPETIAARAETGEMKHWDKIIGGLWALMYFVLVLLIAGLHGRFAWIGQLTLGIHLAGALASVLGFALFSWQ